MDELSKQQLRLATARADRMLAEFEEHLRKLFWRPITVKLASPGVED